MKIVRLLILACALASAPALTSCSTAPTERTTQVVTLKAVGHIAEGAVVLSAQLYRDGKITAEQARTVNTAYDTKFQPAFRIAVLAVQSDLNSIASPDLMRLALEVAALVPSH